MPYVIGMDTQRYSDTMGIDTERCPDTTGMGTHKCPDTMEISPSDTQIP